MLKARNKKVSLLLVLAMLMTMFVGVGTASAAATYSMETCPTFTSSTGTDQALGIISVELPSAVGLTNYTILTVSLPSGVTLTPGAVNVTNTAPTLANQADIYVPQFITGTIDVPNALFAAAPTARVSATGKSIDISFTGGSVSKAQFYIYVNKATLDGIDADMTATLSSNNSSVFPTSQVILGKYNSSGGTLATVKSVKTVGTSGGTIDTITVVETAAGTWEAGDKIKLKLPAGFGWADSPTLAVSGNWRFAGLSAVNGVAETNFGIDVTNDSRLLTITINAAALAASNSSTTARIDIAAAATPFTPSIDVTDDSIAKMGDVTLDVSGDNVTSQDLVIATMADYAAKVVAGTAETVTAGWDSDLSDATFDIEETMAGSLIAGRQITLTLPAGAKWLTNEITYAGSETRANHWPDLGTAADKAVSTTLNEGTGNYFTAATANATTVSNNSQTLKFTIGSTSTSARDITFKDFQISVRANFKGDLNVEVGGNAGVEGTVKIADVVPGLTIENDGKAEIVIGAQNQEVGDIVLKESDSEAIDTSAGDKVSLKLPEGASFSVLPTVEVTEGDAVIDSVDKDGRFLNITFKSSSSTPSTIKVSNIKLTTQRIIPEGDFKVDIDATSSALTDNSADPYFDISSLGSVVIGQCVTPSGATTTTGEFKIGSNIYSVNGVSKVMDVAPYIKNGRTYVPMRYAAEIIGAEVVWDETAQTVTLTKGDTVVVFTIGSTTYTVNGEAKTCDVAPEITNSRTMLPARYVAEAFGGSVGWDAATQTVVIQ